MPRGLAPQNAAEKKQRRHACAGMIEYWGSSGRAVPREDMGFGSKLDTDLYALAKAKARVHSLEVSRDGAQFATFSSDRCAA